MTIEQALFLMGVYLCLAIAWKLGIAMGKRDAKNAENNKKEA